MNATHADCLITRVEAGLLTRRRALGALSALSLSLAPGHLMARQAGVSSTLLVRGETELVPGAALAWRIVRDVAEAAPDAAYERRALGFAVATGLFGALLLTDEATRNACRLTFGEAAFVRDGVYQRRESLGRGAEQYLRIGLVAATEAGDSGGDRVVFSGPAFSTLGGTVTLALQRVEPVPGERFAVSPGAGETLVLVEQGDVELEIGEAAPRELLRTTVGSESSYAIRSVGSAFTLYGGQLGTRVLIATIT